MAPKSHPSRPPRPSLKHRHRERRGAMRRDSDLMLAGLPARFERMEGDVRALGSRVERFEAGLVENNAATERIDGNTRQIVAFVSDVQIVWKACKLIRYFTLRFAKWITILAVSVTSVIAALHAAGSIDVKEWWK